MLEVEGLVVRYDDFTAVDGVDLTVGDRETVAVLGPSGSGKSTLLRAVAGLEPLAAGRIVRDGHDLAGMAPHQRGLGLMFQDHTLFPHRDVLANVAFGLRMRGVARRDAEVTARETLAAVGLEGFDHREVRDLSGGEQQRVALARALAPAPALLMLDEPLGALDRSLRERLLDELHALFARLELSVLFVTHDHDEAFALGDRVAIMHAGRIEQIGAPEAVWNHPAGEFTARFLGWNVLAPGLLDLPRSSAGQRSSRGPGPPVAVRPDALRIDPNGRWRGTVVRRTFRRDHFRLRVEIHAVDRQPAVSAGTTVEVVVRDGQAPELGSEVGVTADASGIVELPAP